MPLITPTAQAVKREINETVMLSLPLIGSWLIYSLSTFIGTAMIGHLSEDALAASVLTNTLWLVISVFFFGIFNSISVLVSRQYGARNMTAISEIMSQAFLLGALICIPIGLALMSVPMVLTLTSQSPEVLTLAITYAHSLLWSVPGTIALIIFEHFFNGIGKTKISLFISLIEVPIEVFLIYIFVFGKLGLPAYGIAGVGYGLAVSFTLTTIALVLYSCTAKFLKPYMLFNRIGVFHKQYFAELIQIGLPVGIMYVIEVGAFCTATIMMARFSTVVLAAHQIVFQYLGFILNAAFAIAQAVSIRIGQNIGKQQYSEVRYSSYAGIGLVFVAMLIMSLLYLFAPQWLLSIDINIHAPENQPLVKEAALLMIVLAFYQIFDGIRIVCAGALRGLKDTRAAMYNSIISFWLIGITCAYFFAFVMEWHGVGIWLGMCAGVIAGTIMLGVRLGRKLNGIDAG
jgi:MATE family multidrug resistance protein